MLKEKCSENRTKTRKAGLEFICAKQKRLQD